MGWVRAYHDRLIANMQRDPPWSGFEKLDLLWPMFLGGGLMILAEWLLNISLHDTSWLWVFIGPGAIWAAYLMFRYLRIFIRHDRR